MHKAIPDPAVRDLIVAQMMQTMKSSIVVTDTSGFIEYVNQFFIELTGYTSKDVVGHNVSMLSSGKTSPEVFRDLWETITQGDDRHHFGAGLFILPYIDLVVAIC